MNFSSNPDEWLNYCDCGEYLGPTKERCDDKRWGCGSPRRGFYCTVDARTGHRVHTWVGDRLHEAPKACSKCGMVNFWEYLKTLDWTNKDPAYWRDIFHHVHERAFGDRIYDMVGEIKRQRYEWRRPKPKYNDYGARINNKLESLLDDASDGLDCVDNYRYALKSSRRDMKRFRRDHGCCGSHTETVIVENREYVIGFNYGH